jgi:hypothetical protein
MITKKKIIIDDSEEMSFETNKNYCNIGEILYKGSTDKNTTHRYGISYDLVFNSQYLIYNIRRE